MSYTIKSFRLLLSQVDMDMSIIFSVYSQIEFVIFKAVFQTQNAGWCIVSYTENIYLIRRLILSDVYYEAGYGNVKLSLRGYILTDYLRTQIYKYRMQNIN